MKNKILSAIYMLTSLTTATGLREIYGEELPAVSLQEILDTAIEDEGLEEILVGSEGFFILPESLALVPDASEIFAEYEDIPAIFISEDSLLGATIYQQTLASGGMLKSLCDKLRKICRIRPAPNLDDPWRRYRHPPLKKKELEELCDRNIDMRHKAECRTHELEEALRRKKIEMEDLRRRHAEELQHILKRTKLFSKCLDQVLPRIVRPFDSTTCEIAFRELAKCAHYPGIYPEIKSFVCGPFPVCCPRAYD